MPIGNTNAQIPGCGTHHLAVQTRDWDASLHLYRDVLGMPVVAQWGTPERLTMLLDIGDGSHMELFSPLPTSPAGDHPDDHPLRHIALTTTDTRHAVELVRQAGYTITVEPKDAQLGPLHVTLAFFIGPNGETIEFFQVNSVAG
jgi:catechol 2,3-dioxygenase-like lactoylglutathione lyase family enzyme